MKMGNIAGDFVREIPAKRPTRGKPNGRWLTLWGRSGTGKTMLARGIYEAFPRRAHWLDWVDLCRRYQSKDDINRALRWACDAEVLVIDDAGAVHQTPATLGLLHGSQPDCLVLCHDPSRLTIEYRPNHPIPPLADAVAQYLTAARITNKHVRLAGVSINSSSLSDEAWHEYAVRVSAELGVPVCDPMRGGLDAIAASVLGHDR